MPSYPAAAQTTTPECTLQKGSMFVIFSASNDGEKKMHRFVAVKVAITMA